VDHQEKIQEERKVWKQRVSDFKTTGGSVSEFAKKHGISVHQFYYWRKKFFKEERLSSAKAKLFGTPQNLIRVVASAEKSSNLPDPKWLANFIKALHENH
jgi:transposase-like protein